MIKKYYSLIKPGIVYGNALTSAAGFFLASHGHDNYWLLFVMLVGLSCIVASACVFNNYIDRGIDAAMLRTQARVSVRGSVSPRAMFIYATLLGLAGVFILVFYTNVLALSAALVGFCVYVVAYSLWAKLRTAYATHVGSIAGAMPPVVGYLAVTNRIDLGVVLLFLILCFWQMAHFFAIALYRQEEYATARVPVWPIKKGIVSTKRQMLVFILLYIIAAALLVTEGYAGDAYLMVTVFFGLLWFGLGVLGFLVRDTKKWARQMFFLSLVLIVVFCVTIALNSGGVLGSIRIFWWSTKDLRV